MKTVSAEALKYAANAFLATKLTFINAMADICEAVGVDIFDVAIGIGLDPRIGKDMLSADPGWGGSCFPKDTRALVSIAAQGGVAVWGLTFKASTDDLRDSPAI